MKIPYSFKEALHKCSLSAVKYKDVEVSYEDNKDYKKSLISILETEYHIKNINSDIKSINEKINETTMIILSSAQIIECDEIMNNWNKVCIEFSNFNNTLK